MIAEPWPPDELPPPPDAAPVGEVVDLFAESAPAGNTPMLAAALEIARLGFPVIPLHTPVNGACDCHRAIALHREAPADQERLRARPPDEARSGAGGACAGGQHRPCHPAGSSPSTSTWRRRARLDGRLP